MQLYSNGGSNGELQINPEMLKRCRKLRRKQTNAEESLWRLLRNRQFHNLKFRRQHHIPPYIADFYCHEKRLIIELDGTSHIDKKEYDETRDTFLKENNFHVIRVENKEVVTGKLFERLEVFLNPSSVTP